MKYIVNSDHVSAAYRLWRRHPHRNRVGWWRKQIYAYKYTLGVQKKNIWIPNIFSSRTLVIIKTSAARVRISVRINSARSLDRRFQSAPRDTVLFVVLRLLAARDDMTFFRYPDIRHRSFEIKKKTRESIPRRAALDYGVPDENHNFKFSPERGDPVGLKWRLFIYYSARQRLWSDQCTPTLFPVANCFLVGAIKIHFFRYAHQFFNVTEKTANKWRKNGKCTISSNSNFIIFM